MSKPCALEEQGARLSKLRQKFYSWHLVFLEVAYFQPYEIFLTVNTLYLSQHNSLGLNQELYEPEISVAGKIYTFSFNICILQGYLQFSY